jgi:lipopolysaccharide/colanic/teichoic acid biosynthesis glycosyltransferase
MISLFDKIISIFALIIFFPLIIFISIGVKFSSKGPIIFRQVRVGKNLKKFNIFKFRTMRYDANRFVGEVENKMDLKQLVNLRKKFITTKENDNRVTKFGSFLRKSSLDELPQLINVILGDMSIVGPRPDTPIQEVDYLQEHWILRHSIKPGITGLAQINGRSNISILDRIRFDLEYVKNRNFKNYLRIIFITVFKIIFSKGAN